MCLSSNVSHSFNWWVPVAISYCYQKGTQRSISKLNDLKWQALIISRESVGQQGDVLLIWAGFPKVCLLRWQVAWGLAGLRHKGNKSAFLHVSLTTLQQPSSCVFVAAARAEEKQKCKTPMSSLCLRHVFPILLGQSRSHVQTQC